MPLSREPLMLDPDPRSVREARVWVSEILVSLGRDDLVDSAELAVSELVTNAVLHAAPPITVSVRGTTAHPRIEVHDHSEQPPEVSAGFTDEESLMSTIGRGISIVASFSSNWGADLSEVGKTVWFEPAKEPSIEVNLAGQVNSFAAAVDSRLADSDDVRLLEVRLLDFPVLMFADMRARYEELRRELRLLALAHGEDYPVAYEVSEVALQVEQERRQSRGLEQLDAAIRAGIERLDLTYQVPVTAPATMARLSELLEAADRFCRQERMLSVAATPEQLALQRWYLGEFARQGEGQEPLPWTGAFRARSQPA